MAGILGSRAKEFYWQTARRDITDALNSVVALKLESVRGMCRDIRSALSSFMKCQPIMYKLICSFGLKQALSGSKIVD